MDVMISSSLTKSTLLHTSKSPDYTLRLAENTKFNNDLRSVTPLQLSSTQRFIPLVLNQCGRRGPHFEAMLLEHASLLIKRSSGCSLLQGPFAVPPSVTLSKVLSSWGNRITWTAQRELAAQVIRGSEAHKSFAAFLSSAAVRGQSSTVPERAGSRLAGTGTTRLNDRTGFGTGGSPYGLTGVQAGSRGTGGASVDSSGVWAGGDGQNCGAGIARQAGVDGWAGVNASMGLAV